MADSLILADQFELLGGAAVSTIPACAGAVFRLAPGHSLDAPQPDANMVQTMLDGERPVGARFSNRQPVLPIVITGPSRAIVAAAKEMLIRAISAEAFTLTWTRDQGLPMVIDGYQALATSVDYNLDYDRAAVSNVTLSFSAGPFGRNDTPVTVEFATPLVGKTGAPNPISVDDFSSVGWQYSEVGASDNKHVVVSDGNGQGIAAGERFQLYTSGLVLKEATIFTVTSVSAPFAGFRNVFFTPNAAANLAGGDIIKQVDWTQSPIGPGPQSAHWTTGDSGVGKGGVYSKSALSLNLSTMDSLVVFAGFGSSQFWPYWGLRKAGPVTFAFTLTDGTNSATTHVTKRVKVSNNSGSPVWNRIQVPIPRGSVNLAAVTAYAIKVSSKQDTSLPYTDLYLDTLQASPISQAAPAQPNYGVIYNLAGIAGSARSAFSLALQMPAGTVSQVTKKLTTRGAQNWQAPLTLVRGGAFVQGCAGGGKGGSATGGVNNFTAGGGGGEGFGDWLPFTPGNQYALTVPFGGSSNSGRASSVSITHDAGTATAQGGGNVADASITGGLAGGSTYTPREQLSGDTATFEGGIANWTPAGNCAIAQTGAQFHGGSKSLQLTSSAAGDMTAASCTAASIKTNGDLCLAAVPVTINGFARSAVSARSVQVGAEFYDINGTSLGQLMGSSVTDSTANFTTNPTATVTPPANSVYLRRLARVLATGAASEVHYFDDFSLKVGYSQAGGVGGAGNNSGNTAGGGGGGEGGITAAGANGSTGATGGSGGSGGAGALGNGAGGKGAQAGSGAYAKSGIRGGGGGGQIGGSVYPGGNDLTNKGGQGQINLTYLQTTQFKTVVVHRPGFHMPDSFCPFVPVDQTDVPDGTTEYEVPQLITGIQARFGSPGRPATFSLYLVSKSWANPASARLLTVQVNHYEQYGGNVYTKQIQLTVTPNNLASQLALIGEITLPDVSMPDDNVNSYFTFTITSAQTGDRFQDILLLDTMGSSVIIQSPNAYTSYFIDAPVATDIGLVLGSQGDRQDAVSVLQYADISGPPLHVDPIGNQSLMCYVADQQAPAAELVHHPAWMLERLA